MTRKRQRPAYFIAFAFANFIAAAGSIFNTVVITLRRRHSDFTPGQLGSLSRKATKARDTIGLTEWHGEFIAVLD
ncbi:hypothetical protein [Pseudomonas oryzihabitans]|uniref:hypothetical protein n=1 Tax=Pseudomonas oryzihabitans TaxID=47885 RepID=UPI001ABF6F0F|nr:hypothetical protein [Pseudomonas oryzihabitans]